MSDDFLPAAAAAEFLGVKRETLYAYVSRGWLQSVPDPTSTRARLYRRADLDRLRTRSEARSGDGPIAAGALRWGAPVLQTRVGTVTERGPAYRGRHAASLLEHDFEQVAELLWTETLPEKSRWSSSTGAEQRYVGIDAIRLAVLRCELEDPTRDVRTDAATLAQARRLLGAMVASIGGDDSERFAGRVAAALGVPDAESAINTTLIVCADHELNASTFAARVAASTGANLYAAVTAALAAFVGPRHGGASRRIRRLVAECGDEPERVLLERLSAGEDVPGFGHPLYEHGDPRFGMLWAAATEVDEERLEPIRRLLDAARSLGLDAPHLDTGLVAVATACELDEGAETILFALGRTAGWTAHAREQMAQQTLLRPRASYVGTKPV